MILAFPDGFSGKMGADSAENDKAVMQAAKESMESFMLRLLLFAFA